MASPPEGVQDLADGEQPDGDGDEVDAVDQVDGPERVSLPAAADVDADGADREADERGQRAEQLVAAKDHDDGEQTRDDDQEVFGWPEGLREIGGDGRGEGQQHGADGAGDERADRRHHERRPGPALFGQWIAVESACHCRGFTGGVDEHGRDRAAVHRAVVDGREHHDRAGRVEPERHGQQYRQTSRWSDAGDDTDDHADQHPADEQQPDSAASAVR